MRRPASMNLTRTLATALATSLLLALPARAEPPVLSMDAVRSDPAAPATSPAAHDISIIFFSDYRCGYCRRANVTLGELQKADPKVRIVYRDWPILSKESGRAAQLAIASKYQGRHDAFHAALMDGPADLSEEGLRASAAKAGVDWTRLEADLAAHKAEIDGLIERTQLQAPALGLQGTPGFLIGDYLVPGAVDLATMQKVIADARAEARK